MKTGYIKDVIYVGGALAAIGSVASTSVEAQGLEGPYVGLSYSTNAGTSDGYAFAEGSAAGGFAGFNTSLGDWTIGAEIATYAGGEVLVTYGSVAVSNVVDIRARVGRTFGNAFVYAAAGVSSANATYEGYGSWTEGLNGTNVGAGFEMGLGGSYFVGGDMTRRWLTGANYVDNVEMTNASIRVGMRF